MHTTFGFYDQIKQTRYNWYLADEELEKEYSIKLA